VAIVGAQDASTAPKMQVPADRRAYTAARAQFDPGQRLAAMRQFLIDYPKSARVSRARMSILELLLANFPDRTAEIDAAAKQIIKASSKGDPRTTEELIVAQKLAETGPNGIDLKLAEKYAKDANRAKDEQTYTHNMVAMYAKFKMPPPKAAALHASYAQDKSEALAVVAEVCFHEGKLDLARSFADQAFAIDPTVDDTNSICGEVALADHDNAKALDSFERAQLYGALRPALQDKMLSLYRDAHKGSDATFAADQDARYRQLFPPPFTPAMHKPEPDGHTAMLALFTGSACSPCVAADLALDAILRSYSRTEVVGLAFDQHIPEPDPLANPDSIAVAARFGDQYTPTYALDGQMLPPGGGSRSDSEELYKGLTKSLDADIARPSAVHLQLTAVLAADGHISAQAHVKLPDEQELREELATLPVPAPPAKPGAKPANKAVHTAPAAAPAPPAGPALQLNFALVEDDVRYSGENGIRFHPMVVRALAKPAGEGFLLKPDAAATLDAAFDPAAISRQLSKYLDSYEQHNERFENTHFLGKNTAMNPANLNVVAWVENTADHRILQAAFVSLAPAVHTGEAQ
jgi:hypothetical protein